MIIFCFDNYFAQQKIKLSPDEYHLWGTLGMGVSSDNGKWISYSINYENNNDTLFLKNLRTNMKLAFPYGHSAKITPLGDQFYFIKEDTLVALETATRKQTVYPNVHQFILTQKGDFLLFFKRTALNGTLGIINLKTNSTRFFNNVIEYKLDPKEKRLAFVQQKKRYCSVIITNLDNVEKKHTVSTAEDTEYSRLTWNKEGKSLGVLSIRKNSQAYNLIFLPNVDKPNDLIQLYPENINSSTEELIKVAETDFFISDDGKKVFFKTIENLNNVPDSYEIEIWKSSDKRLPRERIKPIYKLNLWKPLENKIVHIEQNNLVAHGLFDNQKKVLLLDHEQYLPLHKYLNEYVDVYVLDLESGANTKIIEKQLIQKHHVAVNNSGKYIAYFKNDNWWSFNSHTGTHICLTDDLPTNFNNSKSDRLENDYAYGFGGWTENDNLIVYDEFDIWLIAPDGKTKKRITNGAEKSIQHRIIEHPIQIWKDNFIGFQAPKYSLTTDILIKILNTQSLSEGFGIWNRKEFHEIIHINRKILYVKKIQKENSYVFMESAFDIPPRIIKISSDGTPQIIASSNKQQKKYFWGKSELIHYINPEGKNLKGALIYPANYHPEKKYPLIVCIYENMSYLLHAYQPPDFMNPNGLNTTLFSLEGYFVLLPDIAYKLNQTGRSAVECVSAAIDRVTEIVNIDREKVGLTGHSFGGFEVSYIVGHSNKFKAAVAGAAVNDLLSFYLDIDPANLSNMARFYNGQFRNRIPFSEPEFIAQSPLMNAKTINTPLLLWAATDDEMVAFTQSLKFFAALWKLNKESTLVIYPKDNHLLVNPRYQKDITLKILSWFNHYLKDFPKEPWMNE